MKNIIIGILSILLLMSSTYAYVQKGIAEENEKVAVMNAQLANKSAEEALRQKFLAEEQARLAAEALLRAEQAVQECLKKKK